MQPKINARLLKDICGQDLQKALMQVKQAVRRIVGDRFRLFLFGSRARGTADKDSDVDLLVVLPDDLASFSVKEAIRDAVYELSIKTDYLFSVILVSESVMRQNKGFLFFKAVEEEGIEI